MADVAIHLYDMSDVGFAKLYKQNPPSPDRLPTGAVGAYATSTAAQIVGAIRKVADGDRIKVMRIVAHGNSGTFYFPHLRNYDSCSQTYGDIPKGKLWAPLARLELHGCGLASETSVLRPGADPASVSLADIIPGTFTGDADGYGLWLLRRIASLFNVPTTAAVNAQSVGMSGWGYEGRTVTVQPNGKFLLQDENTRTWDFAAQERSAEAYKNRIIQGYVYRGQYDAAVRQFRDLIRVFPNTKTAAWAQNNLTVAAMKKIDDAAMRPD
jgi:hypothetical protein